MKKIITLLIPLIFTGWTGINAIHGQAVLYGVTQMGGNGEAGVLFEYDPVTNTYTKKFDFGGSNGSWPSSSLLLLDGKFFGLANGGGSGYGTIYEWDPLTQTYTKKHDFDNSNGADPAGDMTLYQDKLYGTTLWGGTHNGGVIFEWDPLTQTYTKKYDFINETGWTATPSGCLTLYNGKLYGVTNVGGPNMYGYIYEWDPVTNIFTKKFDFDELNGFNPFGGLTLYQDKFYGTTSSGGPNGSGVIFEWDPVTNIYTKKIDLDCTTGCHPYMSLTLHQDKLFGVASWGGSLQGGVIFEWDPSTNAYIERHSFDATTDWINGANPQCLLSFSGGKFYGTTIQGGVGLDQTLGVVFEWDPATGIYSKEFDFDGINGAQSGQTAMLEYILPGTDEDGDGFSPSDGDCNDGNPAIYPGATELCNSIDDDCDGEIDEDFVYSSVSGASVSSSLGNSFCVGPGTVLTIENGMLGTGAEWVWYEGWCGNGDPIGTGGSITVTPSAGVHSYHARGEGTCNTSDCVSISIAANFAPYFYFCQEDITVGSDPALCSAVVDYTDVAHNGLPVPLVTYEFSGATIGSGNGTGRGNTFNAGTTYVTITAINECGSDICSFSITVEEDEDPAISACPSNITLETEEGQWGASVSWTPPTATDNCSEVTLVSSHEPGHFFNVGSTPVTYTATDESGNSSTCQFLVTVTPPNFLGTVNISVISSYIIFSDNNPDPGTSINVNATIRNNSNIAAGSFTVQFTDMFTNTAYPQITVPGLNAGQSILVNQLISAPNVPAFVPVQISVDVTDNLDESSESDNSAVRPFICGDMALHGNMDLLASAVPAAAPAGSVIQICGTASYATNPPLNDPSVAGAEVIISIVETGEQFTGYTDEDGNFCIFYRTPNTPGEYHFTVDVTDDVLSGDVSGTFTLTEPEYNCPKDLTVSINLTGITPSPSGSYILATGTSFSGSVHVQNNCTAISEQTTLYIATPAGTIPPYEVIIPALGPGEIYPVSLPSFTMNNEGNFFISATVDYHNIIPDESSETNNTDYKVLIILPPLPDIVAAGGGVLSNLECFEDNLVSFTVRNTGLAPTGQFTSVFSLYISEVFQSSQSQLIANIDPGDNVVLSFPVYVTSTTETFRFELMADLPDLVDELSELNNLYSFANLFLSCKPELEFLGCDFTDLKPVDPMSSGTATVTITLRNQGELAVDEPFEVLFNTSDTSMTVVITEPIAPQQSLILSVEIPIAADECDVLTVIADAGGDIAEHIEDNNEYAVPLCYDFDLVDQDCVGYSIFSGNQYYCNPGAFRTGYYNHGLFEASGFEVKFEISGPGLTGWVYLGTESVYAGNTCRCPGVIEYSGTFYFPQTGTYYVRMTADPDNLYLESDENNNEMIIGINVLESADYQVLSPYIFPSEINPDLNETISFSVSYMNTGCTGFSPIELFTIMDNDPLDSLSVSPLPSGGWNNVAILNTWSSSVPGVHVFRAIIDHDEAIEEGNEMNNEATKAIFVGGAPDYNVLFVSASDDNPETGQEIMLTADVQNEGQSAGSGLLRFLHADGNDLETLISEEPVAIAPGITQSFTVPWLVTNSGARIIARVVSVRPLEFDLSDNEKDAQLNDLSISLAGTDATCIGGDDGVITVSVAGGVSPFIIQWNDPSLFSAVVNVPAGTYHVFVTDINGLTGADTITIGEIDEGCGNSCDIIVEAGSDVTTYFGLVSMQTVSRTAVVTGGTAPFTYSWTLGRPLLCNQENSAGDEAFYGGTCQDNTCPTSGSPVDTAFCSGDATITATLLDTALVCVTVTDANGCAATDCFYVNASDIRCFAGNSGNHKVKMCHKTNSQNNPWVEICVDTNSIDAHLAHGDYLGFCDLTKEGEVEEDENHELHFHLYPNPASRHATLEFISLTESNYLIEIVNMTGRTVYREEGKSSTGENSRILSFPGYAPGIYLVKLNVEGNQIVEKLIIE